MSNWRYSDVKKDEHYQRYGSIFSRQNLDKNKGTLTQFCCLPGSYR